MSDRIHQEPPEPCGCVQGWVPSELGGSVPCPRGCQPNLGTGVGCADPACSAGAVWCSRHAPGWAVLEAAYVAADLRWNAADGVADEDKTFPQILREEYVRLTHSAGGTP